jgi:hypothetical protein
MSKPRRPSEQSWNDAGHGADQDRTADSSLIEGEQEARVASLIDAHFASLQRLHEFKVRAMADIVVDQVLDELSRRLLTDGVDATRAELFEMALKALGNGGSDRDPQGYFRAPPAWLRELHDMSAQRLEVQVIPTVLEFIGTAVASGILGNVAYDALKRVLRRFSKGDSAPVTEALDEVVLFAVAEQCRRYQLRVDPDKLQVCQWHLGPDSARAAVNAKGSELTAEVTVPYNNWRTVGVNVRIRDVSQRVEIARAANDQYHRTYGWAQAPQSSSDVDRA